VEERLKSLKFSTRILLARDCCVGRGVGRENRVPGLGVSKACEPKTCIVREHDEICVAPFDQKVYANRYNALLRPAL
jgi:hypothetical protein